MTASLISPRVLAWHSLRQRQSAATLRHPNYLYYSIVSSYSCTTPAANVSTITNPSHFTNSLQSFYLKSHPCQHQTQNQQTRHMAGHNKWSKIKRKKAINDKARAATHSKAARAIEAASRACNGDMEDLHLQSAITNARGVQLSKERLERAVERGANPHLKGEGEFVVKRYDGMVPNGGSGKVAVIIEALTENRNRTAANVRHLVTKTGGELLPTGANDWMFENVGLVWVSKNGNKDVDSANEDHTSESTAMDIDALLECALEGGATDVDFGIEEIETEDEENESNNDVMIKCEPNNLLSLVQTLKAGGYAITQFENQWLVKEENNKTILDTEGEEKFDKFLDTMDEDLDVTNVFHNASFAKESS